jgi:hypothetical protein
MEQDSNFDREDFKLSKRELKQRLKIQQAKNKLNHQIK